jgi:hypothetical protein
MNTPEIIPIGQLVGGTFAEALNHMVPATLICHRCRLTLAAADYQIHRERECPALFPEEED